MGDSVGGLGRCGLVVGGVVLALPMHLIEPGPPTSISLAEPQPVPPIPNPTSFLSRARARDRGPTPPEVTITVGPDRRGRAGRDALKIAPKTRGTHSAQAVMAS